MAECDKQVVDFLLARGVAPSTQHADGLIAGPERGAASPLCRRVPLRTERFRPMPGIHLDRSCPSACLDSVGGGTWKPEHRIDDELAASSMTSEGPGSNDERCFLRRSHGHWEPVSALLRRYARVTSERVPTRPAPLRSHGCSTATAASATHSLLVSVPSDGARGLGRVMVLSRDDRSEPGSAVVTW